MAEDSGFLSPQPYSFSKEYLDIVIFFILNSTGVLCSTGYRISILTRNLHSRVMPLALSRPRTIARSDAISPFACPASIITAIVAYLDSIEEEIN
jgi:hypothetical protein